MRTRTQECEDWLVSLLRGGPMLQRRVEELAQDAGFKPRMLKDVSKPPLVVKTLVQVSEPGEPYRRAWRWELG